MKLPLRDRSPESSASRGSRSFDRRHRTNPDPAAPGSGTSNRDPGCGARSDPAHLLKLELRDQKKLFKKKTLDNRNYETFDAYRKSCEECLSNPQCYQTDMKSEKGADPFYVTHPEKNNLSQA